MSNPSKYTLSIEQILYKNSGFLKQKPTCERSPELITHPKGIQAAGKNNKAGEKKLISPETTEGKIKTGQPDSVKSVVLSKETS